MTKRAFLAYTARIAPTALPYVRRRPLNMHRYPEGADQPGFWHKQRPQHAPEWLRCWESPDADPGETTAYVVPDEPAALVWCANFGALEWHPWTSRAESPHTPSYALVDLDPGPRTTWDQLLTLARLHRTALEHLGVIARPKVTGRHRDPGLDPGDRRLHLRGHPRVGRAAVAHRRTGRPGAGQLEVGGQGT